MILKDIGYKIHDYKLWFSRAKIIHCLGDSHLQSFEYAAKKLRFKNVRFKFCIVPGATAMGIPNPASKTQAGPIFKQYLKQVPSDDYVLTCLGEVDCGFVIWYRSGKYGESVEKQFELAVGNYIKFIDDLKQQRRNKIIVCSSPLPTIKDGQKWGEMATLRNEVKSTLRQRTDMTFQFNQRLRDHCKKEGHIYLDLETDTVNGQTNLIDDIYLNPNKLDHHLYPETFAKTIVAAMRRIGFI